MSFRRILSKVSITARTKPSTVRAINQFSTPQRTFASASRRTTASSTPQHGQPSRPFHIPPLPVALISVGFICLGIGLYEYLTSDIQKFPVPVRQALRKALYYQQDKDLTLALKYFNEALQLALESDELEKNGAPLTGIMIQLGSLQERMGRLPDAKQTLTLALRHLLSLHNSTVTANADVFSKDLSQLNPVDQRKAVGIAQKLGDITSSMKRDDEAEKWYVWSVEHLLKSSSKPKSAYGDSNELIFDQEHMPDWLTKTDIGAALEALGGFYAAKKKPE
jgi:tetratricopeptide (TPR) repeat protein